MKIITTAKDLADNFARLCDTYSKYDWAVAWAGDDNSFPQGILLNKNKQKLNRLIVGLHFYQTSPEFIAHYKNNPAVRFFKQTDGTFHSKIYLFYNDVNHWEAIIGSSNFTLHGMNKNIETNVLISCHDDSQDAFNDLQAFIKKLWNEACTFDAEELEEYRICCKRNRSAFKKLSTCSTTYSSKGKKIFYNKIDVMNWEEFEYKIKNSNGYQERINQLSCAAKYFKNSFNKLQDIERKRLAGTLSDKENRDEGFDWKFFGSMTGSGYFKQAIKENSIHLSRALDSIPLHDEVTEKHFNEYCEEFKRALPNNKNPLASATRLLAMKRPDVFVCIDSKNKAGLCKDYHIKPGSLNLSTYWPLLIERIRQTNWYQVDNDEEKISDSELFKYRVAMLDCIYYKQEE